MIASMARGLRYSIVPVSYIEHLRLVMDKNKQRAVSILLFLGSILVLMAMWDLSESPSPQVK
jgi:predicted membrane protein